MATYTKETYSEICEFLGLLGNKYVSEIPRDLLKLFEKNKSKDYIPHINPNIPVKEQKLNEDTLTIIALLNLKYWCKDKCEIERLKTVYKNNEEIYQSKLKEQFNYDCIFKNRTKEYKPTNVTAIAEYKPLPFYKKWINMIKQKIRKKG